MVPAGYNQNVQIVQNHDFVMVHNEMVHTARIIPSTDGRIRRRNSGRGAAIRAATGKATRWSSKRRISTTRPGISSAAGAGRSTTTSNWSNATRWSTPTRCSTNSPSPTPPPGRNRGRRRYRFAHNRPVYEYACHEGNGGHGSVFCAGRARSNAKRRRRRKLLPAADGLVSLAT